MIYRLSDMFLLIITVFFSFSFLIIVGIAYDEIEINFNNDYLEEYTECKVELERLTPNCPECVCKAGSGIWYFAFGIIWGLVIMFLIIQNKDKFFKKKSLKNDN